MFATAQAPRTDLASFMAVCSIKGCDSDHNLKRLDPDYNGKDTPLKFCVRHFHDAEDLRLKYKKLESEVNLYITRTGVIVYTQDDGETREDQARRIATTLCRAIKLRLKFQASIKECNSKGHEYWIQVLKRNVEMYARHQWRLIKAQQNKK